MSRITHLHPVRGVRPMDAAELSRLLGDIDHADALNPIPAEAHDRPASPAEGVWLILGTAAALGWIAGLVWFGVVS